MKKNILTTVLMFVLVSVRGQIYITADSIITCRASGSEERFIPVNQIAESLSLEIDKDLLTLRIFGKGHEHAVIEKHLIEKGI